VITLVRGLTSVLYITKKKEGEKGREFYLIFREERETRNNLRNRSIRGVFSDGEKKGTAYNYILSFTGSYAFSTLEKGGGVRKGKKSTQSPSKEGKRRSPHTYP